MSETKNSLKDPPKDLKEAIDWITWVCHYGKGSKDYRMQLKDSVENLPAFSEAKNQALGQNMHPDSFIYKLADKLGKGLLGYEAQGVYDFSGEGIVKNGGQYQSAYHNCNWNSNEEPDYAKTFLFLAILVYYLITFLYWMCKGIWANQKISSSVPFSKFFEAMGYNPSQLDQEKNGDTIAKLLTGMPDGFEELSAAYGSDSTSASSRTYEEFLNTIEPKSQAIDWDRPLIGCFKLASSYLQSRQKHSEITNAIDTIKKELVALSTSISSSTSSTNDFSKLKGYITGLLDKIKTFNLNPGSSEPGSDGLQKAGSSGTGGQSQAQSSPAGPAVGGLLGVGTLGAGAAYGLNLGGLQTTINGLLHLR
ncbi:variant erythrocyte surface antigen-1 family protein [Babesia caballi]|uniref:Variant erythrocyte surface antigen-1 family protein n=1 Tax=Babesia caballi TaxID=5871 RepID=A0AAV4LZL9_BABCB|nr:variant erythrocyte surface antigen-1 family protein [Babesia caballi]